MIYYMSTHCISRMFVSNQLRFNLNAFSRVYLNNSSSFRYLTGFQHKSYLYNNYSPKPFRLCYYAPSIRCYSSEVKKDMSDSSSQKVEDVASVQSTPTKVSQKTRLKQAVRDYGATIIVFHVAISLASLGICYAAISNGVDAIRLLTFLGFSESVITSKVAVGGSTFVIAYAVHKLFAPVRIGITLSVAPFIVRYLRKIKWLKPPKKKE